jgi:hypothetical protein
MHNQKVMMDGWIDGRRGLLAMEGYQLNLASQVEMHKIFTIPLYLVITASRVGIDVAFHVGVCRCC